MLDLMVICAEAGLTLETIFERTASEIKFSSPPVARELEKLRSDLKILGDPFSLSTISGVSLTWNL